MSGEELEGQRRELSGETIAHCDLCGTAIQADNLRTIESISPLAEHDHELRVCPVCWEKIHAGEIDAQSLLAEYEERERREESD